MTTINLGKIKPLYKGAYTGGVTYRPLDFTLYLGNLYICKASSTGNLPTDPAYFDPVVSGSAAAIPNTPAGSIAATTLQAAINELDSEKVAKTAVIALANGGTGATTANAAADAIGAFRRGTLLGTVSQSAGVPTGAVIERGSNANGDYTRWADGTQICVCASQVRPCTTAIGSLFRSEPIQFDFPAAFAGEPVCSSFVPDGNAQQGAFTGRYDTIASLTTTYYRTCVLAAVGTTSLSVRALAIGRWF